MAQTVEEAQAALDAAEAKLASAGTTRERIAASREAATARRALQQANAAARAEAAAAREEEAAAARAKAEAERPKTGAEMAKDLMGVRPVLESESGGPFGGYVQYKPLDEQGRQAIFGWNPATGKPYTDAESAAANAGYNPYAGAVGYEIDPRTGNLNVLLSGGNVMTTGATYKYSPQGYVVPSDAYMENFTGFGYDDYGRMINAQGELVTQADIDTYNSLVATDPEKAREFARGKGFSTTGVTGARGTSAGGVGTGASGVFGTGIPKGYQTVNGVLYYDGVPFTGTYGGSKYINGASLGVDTTGTGSSAQDGGTGPMLAFNTFKNTLGLFFGAGEVSKPWVSELYKVVSSFYKTGSSIDEAFNLALQDARNNPNLFEFNRRFKGIYALQDLRQSGKPVQVPTIAEYTQSQAAMADYLKSSGLGGLATEDFTGDLIGKGVSVSTVADRLVKVFDRIDKLPDTIKQTISRYFPTVDRTTLAKTLLLGEKGTKQLADELAGYEVLSAAEAQGVAATGATPVFGGVTEQRAQEYARLGYTYADILPEFGKIAQAAPTVSKLAGISGRQDMGQVGLEQAVLMKSATQASELERLSKEEEARFGGKAGRAELGLASQRRANRAF